MNWQNDELWRFVCENYTVLQEYDQLDEDVRENVRENLDDEVTEGEVQDILNTWMAMEKGFLHQMSDEINEMGDEANQTIRLPYKVNRTIHYRDEGPEDKGLGDFFLYGGKGFFKRDSVDSDDASPEFFYEIAFKPFREPPQKVASGFEVETSGRCYFVCHFSFNPFREKEEYLPFNLSEKQTEEISRILDPENCYIDCIYDFENDGRDRRYVVEATDPSDESFSVEKGKQAIRSMWEVLYVIAGRIDESL